MNKIFAIAFKDALVRFSSRAEWLFFLILPVLFTFFVGGGLSGGQDIDRRLRLVVVNEAQTELAAQLLTALEASTTVRPEVLPLAEAEKIFTDGDAPALLHIPAKATELEFRAQANDLNAQAVERTVRAVVRELSLAAATAQTTTEEAEQLRPFADEAERQTLYSAAFTEAQTLLADAPERLEITVAATPDSVTYEPSANGSAGQLITWVFIPLIGISGLFAYERQQGTLRRLLVSPTSKAVALLGTISGQVLTALVQMLILVLFGIFVLNLQWGREPLALAVLLLASALAAGALGTMLGTFVKTEGQASGLSIMLGMVMALLGGCWYPIELFPEMVRTAVQVLPTTWAMQGMLDLL
ncbi:MAG: ABC transporter permease, partial [Anaerolineales bacterium]|nr:ABC transporter permease [Anaerolineales bacterium]